jgi:hypothetical protein
LLGASVAGTSVPVRRASIHRCRSLSRKRHNLRLPSPIGYEGKYPSRAQRVTVLLLRPPRQSAACSGVRNFKSCLQIRRAAR